MLDGQARNPTTDEDLITRSAEGDRRAFSELVERHAPAMLRLASAVTGSPATAEDAVQQAFLNAYRNAASFRGEASVRTWLLTIGRHAAHRLRVQDSRQDRVEESLMQLGLDAGWASEDPEAMAIAAEHRVALRSAMSRLSSEDQEVLVLRDFDGLSGSEAAEVLGIGERALKSRLHRARLRLAASLRELAHDPADAAEGGPR